MLVELLLGLITLALCITLYFKWIYKYWARKGVPYEKPTIPFGNIQNPLGRRDPGHVVIERLHNGFKKNGHKFGGIYIATSPIFMVVDLDLVKTIMAKDFSYFTDRGVYSDEKHDPLNVHLFSLEGQEWRNMRNKLSPTFTSGKMKLMFHKLLECGEQMQEYIGKLDAVSETLDIKEILAQFTTDVIGSCAFGVDCNSFKDPNSEFRSNGRKLFANSFTKLIRVFFIQLMPEFAKKIGVPIFEKSITNFFLSVVRNMVKYREDNNVKRNDFLQILMELRQTTENKDGLTELQLAAQAFVFFIAGFETSSTTMTFCLFELARNPDIQEKLRKEVINTLQKHDGKLTYEGVMEMKYMGQVIDETLRKYPPVPILFRKSVKDYKIPDTNVVLDKGTKVFISVSSIHYDPEIYPDPETFDPNRFNDENKAARHSYSFIPFGEGPRNCIGLRFGLMQTRVGLSLILKDYKLTISPKTKLPLEIDPNGFLLTTKDKIWMETHKIK